MAGKDVSLRLLIEAINKSGNTLKGVATDLDKIEKEARETGRATKKMGTESAAALKQMSGETKKLTDSFKKLDDIGNRMMGVGAQLTAMGAGLTAVAAVPVALAGSFEQNMNRVVAVTAGAGENLDALSQKAKEMGRTTKFTAREAAEGMQLLGMAGLDAKEVVDGIGPSLQLASAGGLQLSQAADIATNVMSGFRLEAQDLQQVVDVLANTAVSANTTVSELGLAMSYAAPAAAAAGVSLETTAAAMGVLADAGIKASRGGTAVRGMLTQLSSQTPKATKALQRLGVEISKNDDGTIDLVKTMRDLRDSNWTLADATAIFNRALGSSAIALAEGIEKVEELGEANENAAGKGKTLQEQMEKGLFGAFTKLKSAAEGLALAVGEPLLKPLTKLVEATTKIVSKMAEWAEAHPTLSASIAGIVGVLGILVTVVGTLLLSAGAVVKMIGLMGTGLAGLKTAFLAVGKAILYVVGIIGGTALAVILSFIGGLGVGWLIRDWTIFGNTIDEWAQVALGAIDRFWQTFMLRVAEGRKAWYEFWGNEEGVAAMEKEIRLRQQNLAFIEKEEWRLTEMAAAREEEAKAAKKHAEELERLNMTEEEWIADQLKRADESLKKTDEILKAYDPSKMPNLALPLEELMETVPATEAELKAFFDQLKKSTEEAKKALEDYDKRLKEIGDQRYAREKDLVDKIRALERGRMDEALQVIDLRNEALEKEEAAAKQIAEYQKTGDEAAKKRAMEFLDDAERLWDQYAKSGDAAVTETIEALKRLDKEQEKIEDIEIDFLENLKQQTEAAITIMEATEKRLSQKVEKDVVVKADIASAEHTINQFLQDLEERIVRINVEIDTSQGQKTGGPIRRQTGGKLPGYGGGDKVHILGEPGEYMVRKEAVRMPGVLALLEAINSLKFPDIGSIVARRLGGMVGAVHRTRYQTGGQVTNGPELENFGRVDLRVGNQLFPVIARSDVVDELKAAVSREGLLRSN